MGAWKRPFDDPIGSTRPSTLPIAAAYVTKLPKAEQKLAEWQTAVEILIGAAEGDERTFSVRPVTNIPLLPSGSLAI